MEVGSRRRAVTFVEAIIAFTLATVLAMMTMTAYTWFTNSFGSGSADLAAQTDARVLVENLAADMTHGILVATGTNAPEAFDWDKDHALQIFRTRANPKDDKDFHTKPGGNELQFPGYPAFDEKSDATRRSIPVQRVTYQMRPEKESHTPPQYRVTRQESEGTLVRTEQTPVCDGEPAFKYEFQSSRQGGESPMAGHVTTLALVPFAFVPDKAAAAAPATPPANAGPDLTSHLTVYVAKDCAQLYQISAVGVHLAIDNTVPGATGNQGKLEMVTKLWMEERSASFRFDGAFSSLDEHF